MTIKERLHRMVDEITDEEAEATLRRIDAQRKDPLVRFFDAAPVAGVSTIPLDQIKRKYA